MNRFHAVSTFRMKINVCVCVFFFPAQNCHKNGLRSNDLHTKTLDNVTWFCFIFPAFIQTKSYKNTYWLDCHDAGVKNDFILRG